MNETLGTYRRKLTESLREAWGDEAQAVARALLCDHLGLSFTQLIMRDGDSLSESETSALDGMAVRLAQREPLQYVTGQAQFCGLTFAVRPGVLIPRPETEELVEWIADECGGRDGVRLLDIGTGSGCIAIASKAKNKAMDVSAIDVSAEALSIAGENARTLEADVHFSQCDILRETPAGGPWDVVVSNPPYVRQSERATMTADVLNHEPSLALFVDDADPLIFYRTIARRCSEGMIRHGGLLFFEINEAFGKETCEMLRQVGYADVMLRQDFTGRDRMVKAMWP